MYVSCTCNGKYHDWNHKDKDQVWQAGGRISRGISKHLDAHGDVLTSCIYVCLSLVNHILLLWDLKGTQVSYGTIFIHYIRKLS
jgi:hypothetical protein